MENRRADDGRIQAMHDIIIGEVQPRMKKIDKLDEAVNGNGSPGLKIKSALHDQAISRLWYVGGGAVSIILIFIGIVAAYG